MLMDYLVRKYEQNEKALDRQVTAIGIRRRVALKQYIAWEAVRLYGRRLERKW